MNAQSDSVRRGGISVVLVALSLGCSKPGEMAGIDLRVASSRAPTDVGIEFEGGWLRISGGKEPLAEDLLLLGQIRFDQPGMRPEVTEGVVDGRTSVAIEQPGAQNVRGRSRNEWDLILSRSLPLRLSILHRIAGVAELRLASLNLEELDIQMGAGDLLVDFTGAPLRRSVRATIDHGHGEVRVHVPLGVGVRVRGRKAVGEMEVVGIPESDEGWQNALFGEEGRISIDVAVGIGSGRIRVETIE